MITVESYLFGLVTIVYITALVVLAIVRWFHMCHPYDKKPEYYYPGRPFMILCFLCATVLLPYVFNPDSIDSWFLVKTYFLPMHFFIMTLMMLGYFTSVMQRRYWLRPLIATGIPVVLLLLAELVLAIWPGEQLANPDIARIFTLVIYLFGIISTVVCVVSLRKVREWALRFDEDDYSNPVDFPVKFANVIIMVIFFCVAMLWVAALVNNRFVMSGAQLMLVIVSVSILVYSLQPNRNRELDLLEKEEGESATSGNPMSKKTAKEVLAAVRKVVETDQAFLEPHLTLNDVAARSGYNRTYVTKIIKTEYGGFFNYINSLRLKYFEAYKLEHPDASILEIASESGFGSRQSYYNVKDKLDSLGPAQVR